ncbi:hypothetical protein TNCV_91271 [Trichonephila clavipes]|nr:hypothetical protein TNCV_91271 [Trichonephila clavipes]
MNLTERHARECNAYSAFSAFSQAYRPLKRKGMTFPPGTLKRGSLSPTPPIRRKKPSNGTFRSGATFNRPEKPMKKMVPKFKSALDVLRFYYGFWINSESLTSIIIKDGTVLRSKMCQRVSGHF